MKRKVLMMIFAVSLALAGCSGKDAEPVRGTSSEPVEESAETPEPEVLEETPPAEEPEEAEAEEPEEVKESQVSDNTEKVSEAEEVAPNDLSFEDSLAEYLEMLDKRTYELERNEICNKSRFYADDINEDGYPEVCQYMERDLTATIKEMRLAVFTVKRYWNEEERRWAYDAVFPFTNETAHNSAESFGSDEIIFSYTKGSENILMHYETCSGNDSRQTIYDEVRSFRDGEMLHNGYATKEVLELEGMDSHIDYITVTPDYKHYRDEERYNSFDRGSDYETVIGFSADEGWTTLQDALDHPGELP